MHKKLFLTMSLAGILIAGSYTLVKSDPIQSPCTGKTQCTQCYRSSLGIDFYYNCCDKDFKNCKGWWGYGAFNPAIIISSFAECNNDRTAFGCDEYCRFDEPNKFTCPSHKK